MTTLPLQPALPLGVHAHNNRGLFADHYLNNSERLRALDEWKQAAGVSEAFQKIAQLYDRHAARFTKRTNEAQTEKDFICPVLNLLWGEECYQVQVTIPNVDGRRQPDYAFFRTAADRQAAEPHLGTLDYWRDVPCLGDAKKWVASLDKERGADENPSAQICNYLYRSRVRWGILTNGRIWRLYEREKSSAGGVYYEVNLAELLQRRDLERFKYFYLFFRREAFLPDQRGISFVEKVFQGSVDYATEVGDRLKESVYDALRLLMNGFLEHPSNGLNRYDSDTLKLVHENCLIILYRLLFLLYAEDRDLLPRKTGPYASYSLYRLQCEINQHLREGKTYPPMSRRFWGELTNLFALIDQGFPKGGIPAYNGGLFSPSKYPHIAHMPQPGVMRWDIGDHRLAEVVDMLAYQRERWNEPGTQDIDYNTLEVQHLGSIYEGLLELQPQIADEPKVETLEDGKPVFKPAHDVPNPRPIRGQPPRTVNKDEVYLVTNRGERKATGSYYTPKYIVDYIVQNTIGPLVDEAAKTVAELRPEVEKETAKLKRKHREWDKSSAPDAAEHIASLNKLIEKQKRRLLEPYLSLKILDPAIGSGHFLVGAADFLSLAMATDPNLLPLDEMGSEDPQAFYKRLVVERCLYGVDLNPLAVELAKLSLWLHTVSKGKALSFLDHHLRCGNSLIGARIEDDLATTPPKLDAHGRIKKRDTKQLVLGFTETLTAKHLHYLLDTFRKIVETPTGDAGVERMKDKWYRDMDKVRDKFRAVANGWLAPYFAVPVTPEQYQHAVTALRGTEDDWRSLAQEAWFQDAQAVAHDKRLFHWELEFPEVFFDAHGFKQKEERGFDVIIGNPPWVNLFGMSENDRGYFRQRYHSPTGKYDIYVVFIESGVTLTGKRFGMIIPNYTDGEELKLIDLRQYPKAFQYLFAYKPVLLQRRFWGQTIATAGKQFYEIWNPSPFMFAPKILYAEIASVPTFTLDLSGEMACLKTCYCIVLKDGLEISLKFLLSLLNSRLLFYYITQWSPTMRGGKHYRFLTQYVERLPIRRIAFTTPEGERAHLLDKGKRLYERCLSKGNNDCVLGFIQHQLAQTPERADVVHDLLAFLAEQMIEMNKQKQAEVKGFLTWLERKIDAKVEDLSNKTKLRAYHEHDLETLLTVLGQNRRRLNIDPDVRAVQESIEREFNQSIAKLMPLMQRIAATDRLIDLIVYRLYRLTEEEIAIVDRGTSGTVSSGGGSGEV